MSDYVRTTTDADAGPLFTNPSSNPAGEADAYDPAGRASAFSATASTSAKEHGMQAAADAKGDALAQARSIARDLALANGGETDADEVGKVLYARGIVLGPAAGSLFKGGEWQFTGKRKASARKTNHGREIKVWRLVR